jgi:1,2-diacylglycerol 3-alpha-glucosyltransferase
MKVGFFTDTYFPQVSGVATSIKTLKEELEKLGHQVYIFTTTDPKASSDEGDDIIRMPSVPFVSFTDRRIVVRGMLDAYLLAKDLNLDLIHTHTEFGAGLLGKMVAHRLKIPVIHTFHTMYEDYLHYIAKGKVIRPTHVKLYSKFFLEKYDGVVCPSQRVIDTLQGYGISTYMRAIPTGIDVENFIRPDITEEVICQLRAKLDINEEEIILLSLSRLSYEKNIHVVIAGMPEIIESLPNARLVIVGEGPYREELEEQVEELGLSDYVTFVGMVPNKDVAYYYRAADYFVSASTSETQGLTYTETMAAGTQAIVQGNTYIDSLFDDVSLGITYYGNDNFARTVIDYVKKDVAQNDLILQDKLYDISSENFGLTMYEFYLDTLITYSRELRRRERNASLKRIKVKLPKPKLRKQKNKSL